MLKKEIRVGGVYQAKVSGKITKVRVDSVEEWQGFKGASGHRVKAKTRYHVTNLTTGRTTVFQSASKFRGEVPGPA